MIENIARSIVSLLVIFIPGVLLVVRGIRMVQGSSKAWYFARHIYAGSVYAQIPLGMSVICISIVGMVTSQASDDILFGVAGFLGVIAVIFNFVRPSFLKPAWLRWLEEKYGHYMMTILKAEAHEMGLELWESKMQTQADIEAWAEEVLQKHSKMRHEQRLKKRTS